MADETLPFIALVLVISGIAIMVIVMMRRRAVRQVELNGLVGNYSQRNVELSAMSTLSGGQHLSHGQPVFAHGHGHAHQAVQWSSGQPHVDSQCAQYAGQHHPQWSCGQPNVGHTMNVSWQPMNQTEFERRTNKVNWQPMNQAEFENLVGRGGFDGLFQNMAPGAAWQTIITGPTGQTASSGWRHVTHPATPGDLPKNANEAAAFDFDRFFSHFDEAFKQPTASSSTSNYPSGTASTVHPTGGCGTEAQQSLSFASNQAVHELTRSDIELAALEHAVDAVFQELAARRIEKGTAQSQLAQIEARLQKLESSSVDNVQTSSLTSGKEKVKCMKKDQLHRLELLFSRIESLFKQLRET